MFFCGMDLALKKCNKQNNRMKTIIKRRLESICNWLQRFILSDKSLKCKVVYGPVRSRKLGLVLGINNIKNNLCSYDCIYCPNGGTSCCTICSNNCLSPYELFFSVRNKIEEISSSGKKIDYILFAGKGDPVLDTNLPEEISILREFGYKIAVYTNSALLWNENIRENLMFADYVLLKVDTVNEDTWLKINRPHQRLRYNLILDGIEKFAQNFKGKLVTETTLVKNINDNETEIENLSKILNNLNIETCFFTIPIYSPSENYAVGPDELTLQKLSEKIIQLIPNAKLLCCPKEDEFYATGDFEEELLGLLELHPVSEDAVLKFAGGSAKNEELNQMLINKIIKTDQFNGKNYYTIFN
jgi:wyosine [tRNA(Phe)-imidazoG37] synthetase (radical SAM superfamily)